MIENLETLPVGNLEINAMGGSPWAYYLSVFLFHTGTEVGFFCVGSKFDPEIKVPSSLIDCTRGAILTEDSNHAIESGWGSANNSKTFFQRRNLYEKLTRK